MSKIAQENLLYVRRPRSQRTVEPEKKIFSLLNLIRWRGRGGTPKILTPLHLKLLTFEME
jgi:hypothetical protein